MITDRKTMMQLAKYAMVGVLNTFLTLFVIFLCKSVMGINDYVSNAFGYLVGFINSFMCNKVWVFRSSGAYVSEAGKFLLGFLICYAIQFMVVWSINQSWFGDTEYDLCGFFTISGYGIATLIGNVAYTGCNFLYNKFVTFRTPTPA